MNYSHFGPALTVIIAIARFFEYVSVGTSYPLKFEDTPTLEN